MGKKATEYKGFEDLPEYLYHVTTVRRLEAISEDGLVAGRARAIGASAYDSHAKQGIFLTVGEGVFFWHARAEDHAEHGSDDLLEDGVVPVVLRVMAEDIDGKLIPDEIGTGDAKHDAWIASGPIEPVALEVFDGEEWVSIVENWDAVDPALGVEEFEEDDGETFYLFPNESKLFPPELMP